MTNKEAIEQLKALDYEATAYFSEDQTEALALAIKALAELDAIESASKVIGSRSYDTPQPNRITFDEFGRPRANGRLL